MSLNANALAAIRAKLANPDGLDDLRLMESVLRTAAIWRSLILANTMANLDGLTVQHGPFAGMTYIRQAS
jgi:hypothetical protein